MEQALATLEAAHEAARGWGGARLGRRAAGAARGWGGARLAQACTRHAELAEPVDGAERIVEAIVENPEAKRELSAWTSSPAPNARRRRCAP